MYSVVVTTYNRKDVLLRSLDLLLNQEYPRDQYEIIVVDDGSSDGTEAALQPLIEARQIRYHCQKNAGPAKARNVGVRMAHGDVVLFLGDDIFAPCDLLRLHTERRAQFPGQHVAVLGTTTWSSEIELTPLMRYSRDGKAAATFQFKRIPDHDNVSYHYFFTGNLSVPRDFMLEHGMFDEDFRYAFGEDTELGYRLQQCGLRIVLEPRALAAHYHLLTYANFRRRAQVAGEVSILHVRKHPHWASLAFLNLSPKGRLKRWVYDWIVRAIVDPLLLHADARRWDHPVLPRLYQWTLRHHTFMAQLKKFTQFVVYLSAVLVGQPELAMW
jgi:glycosyltransferase involved in cell wall biosynthesis